MSSSSRNCHSWMGPLPGKTKETQDINPRKSTARSISELGKSPCKRCSLNKIKQSHVKKEPPAATGQELSWELIPTGNRTSYLQEELNIHALECFTWSYINRIIFLAHKQEEPLPWHRGSTNPCVPKSLWPRLNSGRLHFPALTLCSVLLLEIRGTQV